MGGSHTFLLFICITHFFIVNGKQIPPTARPKNQDRPAPYPPPSTPKPKAKPSPKRATFIGFESPRLKLVYPVIQAFKLKVKVDPIGVTKTWNGTNICGDYAGFICDTVPDYNQKAVSVVNFSNFNLGGDNLTITDFLTGLQDIVSFYANSNGFTGSIPTDISTLRYLNDLDLSNNKFTGNFPSQLLHANKLLFLDLRFNTFAGIIPPGVFLLKLDVLNINNNNLIQKLPDNLGSTPARYLNLANNKFIGGIPPSIGQANNTLLEVLFLNNQLTGCLPYEIGLLKKANVFDVGYNELTGPIPHSFQCLKKMKVLNLTHNMFYGMVPEEVCSLPKLKNFNLSYNYFTKVGPQCQQLITKGHVDVKMNCILDFPNQRLSADCAKFFSKTHSCPNEKSLAYVPCKEAQAESASIMLAAPETVAVEDPTGRSYRALSQNRAVYD